MYIVRTLTCRSLDRFNVVRRDLFGEMEQKRPAFLLCGGLEMYSRLAENSVRVARGLKSEKYKDSS